MLGSAGRVITTGAGAGRLEGTNAVGLVPWQSHRVQTRDGRTLEVTATPARHGPPNRDRGPVIGFALAYTDQPDRVVYVSGDTVWFEGVADVGRRFKPEAALLFMGAARVREVGPARLTLTADEAVSATRALGNPLVVPLHFEDWGHFSESRHEIERAFAGAQLADRLRWPGRGPAVDLGEGRELWSANRRWSSADHGSAIIRERLQGRAHSQLSRAPAVRAAPGIPDADRLASPPDGRPRRTDSSGAGAA